MGVRSDNRQRPGQVPRTGCPRTRWSDRPDGLDGLRPTDRTDGFNQAFGFNALTGDHGSKQGWSDPGRSPVNLHSVGWTDRYFAAILQTSATATYATMRATSTRTAQLIAEAGLGGAPPSGR